MEKPPGPGPHEQPQPPYGGPTETSTVIVTGMVPNFPNTPVNTKCPNCHSQIVTNITYVNGTLVWICVIVLILIGCWLGCCLIPTCIDDLKDVEHRCPQCNAYLGVKKRL